MLVNMAFKNDKINGFEKIKRYKWECLKKQNSSLFLKNLKFSFHEVDLFLYGVQLVLGISVNVCQVVVDYEAVESLMGDQGAENLLGGRTRVQVAVRHEADC